MYASIGPFIQPVIFYFHLFLNVGYFYLYKINENENGSAIERLLAETTFHVTFRLFFFQKLIIYRLVNNLQLVSICFLIALFFLTPYLYL